MRLALSLTAAATVFGGAAAMAQTPPPVAPPYHLIDVSENNILIVAAGTVSKSRDIAGITVIVGSSPATLAQNNIARLDMGYQFNCRNSTYRTPVAAAYDASGGFMGAIDDDDDWEAVNPTAPSAVIMNLACNNVIPPDSEVNGDPNAIIGVYREWISEGGQ